jgi:4-hydroxy-tetrahydrodipicolinate synthase
MGAAGRVAGPVVAFLADGLAVCRLMQQRRTDRAPAIRRRFRPLADLDASVCLVQNIRRAEVHAIGSGDRVRVPRQPPTGDCRAGGERVIRKPAATRPVLPGLARTA